MEIVDIVEESPAATPEEAKPAPIETSPRARQSLGVETLEDRVLMTIQAAPAPVSAEVEPPEAPAAYVAQQHPANVQPEIGDMQASVSDALVAPDSESTAGGDAETPDRVNGNSNGGGLPGPSSEPHAEVVDRASERRFRPRSGDGRAIAQLIHVDLLIPNSMFRCPSRNARSRRQMLASLPKIRGLR